MLNGATIATILLELIAVALVIGMLWFGRGVSVLAWAFTGFTSALLLYWGIIRAPDLPLPPAALAQANGGSTVPAARCEQAIQELESAGLARVQRAQGTVNFKRDVWASIPEELRDALTLCLENMGPAGHKFRINLD